MLNEWKKKGMKVTRYVKEQSSSIVMLTVIVSLCPCCYTDLDTTPVAGSMVNHHFESCFLGGVP